MTKTQVLALLNENRNERGIADWKKLAAKTGKLKSFGIGLSQLRKLAKQVGRNHKLAKQLWKSDSYDAKIIGLLIDDPKQLSREQVEKQVEELQGGMFAHVFASCDVTLAKTPFAFELACDWMESRDDMRRRCGYPASAYAALRQMKNRTETVLYSTASPGDCSFDARTMRPFGLR